MLCVTQLLYFFFFFFCLVWHLRQSKIDLYFFHRHLTTITNKKRFENINAKFQFYSRRQARFALLHTIERYVIYKKKKKTN